MESCAVSRETQLFRERPAIAGSDSADDMTEEEMDGYCLLMATTEQRRVRVQPPPSPQLEGKLPVHIPSFLDEAEISCLYAAAGQFYKEKDLASLEADGAQICFTPSHTALNLHHAGWFANAHPTLNTKIVCAIHAHAPADWSDVVNVGCEARCGPVNVRCVEFHKCAAGPSVCPTSHVNV